MATQVRTIIEQAIGTSLRNRREAIANESVELILVLRRYLLDAFMDATAIFPEYFGERVVVSYDALLGGWARPARALSMYRIERTPIDEVVVVFDRDPYAERLKPTVLERGGVYLPGLSPDSPVAGDLVMIYARRPDDLPTGNIDVDIDAGFADEFVPMLVYGLALYMATKDSRADEIQKFTAEYDSWRTMWRGRLTVATTNSRVRWAPLSSVSRMVGTVRPEAT